MSKMIKSDLAAPTDGRQSQPALDIQRGTMRMLRQHGFASLSELTLKSGRRADLMAINAKGEIWIIEIKSSREDFRSDKKWPDYGDFCDRFYFASNHETAMEIFPLETGLILADSHGAEEVRPAPEHKLSAARRKAVMLLFAKHAANRLHDIMDPGVPSRLGPDKAS